MAPERKATDERGRITRPKLTNRMRANHNTDPPTTSTNPNPHSVSSSSTNPNPHSNNVSSSKTGATTTGDDRLKPGKIARGYYRGHYGITHSNQQLRGRNLPSNRTTHSFNTPSADPTLLPNTSNNPHQTLPTLPSRPPSRQTDISSNTSSIGGVGVGAGVLPPISSTIQASQFLRREGPFSTTKEPNTPTTTPTPTTTTTSVTSSNDNTPPPSQVSTGERSLSLPGEHREEGVTRHTPGLQQQRMGSLYLSRVRLSQRESIDIITWNDDSENTARNPPLPAAPQPITNQAVVVEESIPVIVNPSRCSQEPQTTVILQNSVNTTSDNSTPQCDQASRTGPVSLSEVHEPMPETPTIPPAAETETRVSDTRSLLHNTDPPVRLTNRQRPSLMIPHRELPNSVVRQRAITMTTSSCESSSETSEVDVSDQDERGAIPQQSTTTIPLLSTGNTQVRVCVNLSTNTGIQTQDVRQVPHTGAIIPTPWGRERQRGYPSLRSTGDRQPREYVAHLNLGSDSTESEGEIHNSPRRSSSTDLSDYESGQMNTPLVIGMSYEQQSSSADTPQHEQGAFYQLRQVGRDWSDNGSSMTPSSGSEGEFSPEEGNVTSSELGLISTRSGCEIDERTLNVSQASASHSSSDPVSHVHSSTAVAASSASNSPQSQRLSDRGDTIDDNPSISSDRSGFIWMDSTTESNNSRARIFPSSVPGRTTSLLNRRYPGGLMADSDNSVISTPSPHSSDTGARVRTRRPGVILSGTESRQMMSRLISSRTPGRQMELPLHTTTTSSSSSSSSDSDSDEHIVYGYTNSTAMGRAIYHPPPLAPAPVIIPPIDGARSSTELMLVSQRAVIENLLETYIILLLSLQQQQQMQTEPQAPEAMKQSQIDKLPLLHAQKEHIDAELSCAICCSDFELMDHTMNLPCDHMFHPQCITSWLLKSATCPVCRYLMNPSDEDSSSSLPSATVG